VNDEKYKASIGEKSLGLTYDSFIHCCKRDFTVVGQPDKTVDSEQRELWLHCSSLSLFVTLGYTVRVVTGTTVATSVCAVELDTNLPYSTALLNTCH
jgi:hypothetical protein